MSLATVCSMSGAASLGRAAGRPEPAAAGVPGDPPGGRRGVGPGAPRRRAPRRSPPDRGLLLGTTYRLHPDVNAFISDAFYEGRLATAPGTERQDVGRRRAASAGRGSGTCRSSTRTRPTGRRRRRRGLPRRSRRLRRPAAGPTRRAGSASSRAPDVLVVAPYNAQVAEIDRAVKDRLGDPRQRRDRRQVPGPRGAGRGLLDDHLLARGRAAGPRVPVLRQPAQRRGVAGARAWPSCVASPELLRVACRTPEQMRLVNALLPPGRDRRPSRQPRTPAPAVDELAPVAPSSRPPERRRPLLLFPELGPAGRRRADRADPAPVTRYRRRP